MIKIDKHQAFVIFKKPFENNFNYLSGPWIKTNEYKKLGQGYLFAPFDLKNQHAYFIEGLTSRISVLPENIDSILPQNLINREKESSLPDYRKIVSEGIDQIAAGAFQKLVLSRYENHPIPEGFKITTFFQDISKAYPECFVYLLYIPNENCWLGASPEILAKSSNKDKFETIALAGTMLKDKFSKGENWGEKEILEQALVTRFILDNLKKYAHDQIESKGPENIQTGNLIHLQTSIKTNIQTEKALSLVLELHPTPAISGLPQLDSINYILEKEAYNREYYSGFSGIIEGESIFEFYVNLRCMQLFREEAILYAGAGITADSNPEKEYIETANKINALKRFFNAPSNSL